MLWVNRLTGLALIVLMAVLWQVSAEYPDTAPVFPRVMFLTIVVLSVVMIVRSFIPAVAPRAGGEGESGAGVLVRPLVVFGLATVALVAVSVIGFFAAMAVLAAALIPVLGVRQRGWYALAAVILLAGVYVAFVIFLNVPLTWRPPGL